MTIFSKNLGGHGPFGYAYDSEHGTPLRSNRFHA